MIINASVQVVPLTRTKDPYPLIDEAIALIQQSGLKYLVGALETTIEGEYEPVQKLIREIEDFCYSQNEIQFLIYKKIHLCGGQNILIEDKTGKFKK